MKAKILSRHLVSCFVILILATGWAHAGKKDRLQRASDWPLVDLTAYESVFVEDCVVTDPKAEERKNQEILATAPERMANYVAWSIDRETFPKVERRAPKKKESGLLVRVELTQYKPGSAGARFLMVGTGAAHLDLVVHLIDAESGNEIGSFTETRNFAWGGFAGASRGITLMEENAAVEIAAWLSLAKGVDKKTVLSRLRSPDAAEPPEQEYATVYILRPQSMVGAASRFRVGVDATTLGDSKRSSYYVAYVTPGEHKVWWGSDKKQRGPTIEAEAGKEYFFMAMGMKQMPDEKGRKKLGECKLVRRVDLTGG